MQWQLHNEDCRPARMQYQPGSSLASGAAPLNSGSETEQRGPKYDHHVWRVIPAASGLSHGKVLALVLRHGCASARPAKCSIARNAITMHQKQRTCHQKHAHVGCSLTDLDPRGGRGRSVCLGAGWHAAGPAAALRGALLVRYKSIARSCVLSACCMCGCCTWQMKSPAP